MKDDVEFNLGLDKLFSQLAELSKDSDINPQAYSYLLLLWGYFEISVPSEGDTSGPAKLSKPNRIQINESYQILDYGSHLKTASGKHYGSYSTGRLLLTVREMIKLLSERGAKKIQFAGLDAAQRFAWLECEKYKIKVTNFMPDTKTQILCDRLPRLDSLRHSVSYITSGK